MIAKTDDRGPGRILQTLLCDHSGRCVVGANTTQIFFLHISVLNSYKNSFWFESAKARDVFPLG